MTRTVKSVSFANNDYENKLLAFATDPAQGKFGTYVKRLIDRDMHGQSAPVNAVVPFPTAEVEPDKRAMVSGFL